MPVCMQCGQPTDGAAEICSYHVYAIVDGWATANRMMCDLLHRGIVPPAPSERDDEDIELLVSH